jgi:hypothetical protein
VISGHKPRFNPARTAFAEATGWRMYYERKWLRFAYLIVRLCQDQFHIPFPWSALASFHVARAAAEWNSKRHDSGRALRELERYYRLALRYSDFTFDASRAARVELDYWEVHRRLAHQEDKSEFVTVFVQLHSLIFSIRPDQARRSAELRVEANNLVDGITAGSSDNPAHDWNVIEQKLTECYQSILQELG